jgi:hypothetical protein
MQHSKQVEIGGYTYQLVHFPATKSYKLQRKLLKKFGSAISGAFSLLKDTGNPLDQDVEKMGPVVASLFFELGDDDADQLISDLLGGVRFMQGETLIDLKPMFDVHFQGRTSAIWMLLFEQLKFQYQDFTDTLAGLSASLSARVQSAQKTSSGSSGESLSLKSQRSKK